MWFKFGFELNLDFKYFEFEIKLDLNYISISSKFRLRIHREFQIPSIAKR